MISRRIYMQHLSVEKLFQEQIKHYSRAEQSIDSPIIYHFLSWVNKKKMKKTLKICEFGGGAGQLLNKIGEYYPNARFTNAEIVGDYKQYLVSKKIKFLKKSILNSDFPDKSFDVLIIRDLLHHLVGRSYKQAYDNQLKALEELKRLIRPGGVIFISEYTNRSAVVTRIIYFLSKLNTKIGISLPSWQISPNTIVAFLTPGKLKQLCDDTFGKKYVLKEFSYNVNVKLVSELLHFGAGLKRMIIVIEEPSRP